MGSWTMGGNPSFRFQAVRENFEMLIFDLWRKCQYLPIEKPSRQPGTAAASSNRGSERRLHERVSALRQTSSRYEHRLLQTGVTLRSVWAIPDRRVCDGRRLLNGCAWTWTWLGRLKLQIFPVAE
jgi:hypothetical protein